MAASQALLDALATARVRLADEERAIQILTERNLSGIDSRADLRFARSERDHYRALVERLEGRIAFGLE